MITSNGVERSVFVNRSHDRTAYSRSDYIDAVSSKSSSSVVKRAPAITSFDIGKFYLSSVPANLVTPEQWIQFLTSDWTDSQRQSLMVAYNALLNQASHQVGNVYNVRDIREGPKVVSKSLYVKDKESRHYPAMLQSLIDLSQSNDPGYAVYVKDTAIFYGCWLSRDSIDSPESAHYFTQPVAGQAGVLSIASPLAAVGYEFINNYLSKDLFSFSTGKTGRSSLYWKAANSVSDPNILKEGSIQPTILWPKTIPIDDDKMMTLLIPQSRPKIQRPKIDPKNPESSDTSSENQSDVGGLLSEDYSLRRFPLTEYVIPVSSTFAFEDVGFVEETESTEDRYLDVLNVNVTDRLTDSAVYQLDVDSGDVGFNKSPQTIGDQGSSVFDLQAISNLANHKLLQPTTKWLLLKVCERAREYPAAKFVVTAVIKDSATHRMGLAFDLSSRHVFNHAYNPYFMYKRSILNWLNKLFSDIPCIIYVEDNHFHFMPRCHESVNIMTNAHVDLAFDNGRLMIFATKPVKTIWYDAPGHELDDLISKQFFSLTPSEVAVLPSRQYGH